MATLLTLLRPRDRKWKAGATWKGIGRHGEGKGEEFVDDGLDAFDELLDRPVELVGDAVVDQGVEGMLLEDPPLLPRR